MEAHAWGQSGSAAELVPPRGAAPSFEVATIKASRSDSAGTNFGIAPGRFNAENATVEELIKFAYNVKTNDGIEGEPKWTGSEKFDVNAKISDAEAETLQKLQPSQRIEQYRLMVRSLLAERCGLITSTQTKELPVYALVIAKDGPKLKVVEPGKEHTPFLWGGSKGKLNASSVSMALFADWISGNADLGGRAVIDQTELKGSFDFTLTWTRVESGTNAMSGPGTSQTPASVISTDQGEPPLFTALQEQLGLKLESRKGPVEVLAIDHVERPSPN
jgi:uncharacterized protein (TIGR03435 family)